MVKTVAKIVSNGHYRVSYDDTEQMNPYTVYREWYDKGWHSKKLASYADMVSCMYHITEEIIKH